MEITRHIRIETRYIVGCVSINESDIILATPPIWKEYKGKLFGELIKFLQNSGKIKVSYDTS